jgi:Lon protease-like protein
MGATITIPLFPLNTVLFPGGVLRLQIFEVRYLDMIGKCLAENAPFGVVSLTQGAEVRLPEQVEEFEQGGTLAMIEASATPSPGLMHVRCRGEMRFDVLASECGPGGLWQAKVRLMDDDQLVRLPSELIGAADALGRVVASLGEIDIERWPLLPPFHMNDCGWVANRWCELLPIDNRQKQALLMLDNPLIRLELMHDMLDEHGLITS